MLRCDENFRSARCCILRIAAVNPLKIGSINVIRVDNDQTAHTCPRKNFNSSGTGSASSDYGCGGTPQPLQCLFPERTCKPRCPLVLGPLRRRRSAARPCLNCYSFCRRVFQDEPTVAPKGSS